MAAKKSSRNQVTLPFRGISRSSGRHRKVKLEGRTVGRWKVVQYVGYHRKFEQSVYLCRCKCGKLRLLRQVYLMPRKWRPNGLAVSMSCGCLKRDRMKQDGNHAYAHGHCRTNGWSPEYRVWCSIKQRCRNSLAYLEKGIRICRQWEKSFVQFLKDVGPRPSLRHTLDRINNSKGYKPGNVRWATHDEQARNKTSNRMLTCDGVTLCIADWSRKLGCNSETISRRLKDGWSLKKTLTTSPRKNPDLTLDDLI